MGGAEKKRNCRETRKVRKSQNASRSWGFSVFSGDFADNTHRFTDYAGSGEGGDLVIYLVPFASGGNTSFLLDIVKKFKGGEYR